MYKRNLGAPTLELTVASLATLLHEGRDGKEDQYSDEAIADWCYEFSVASHFADGTGSEHAKKIAATVSSQWHADVANAEDSGERVLTPDQYETWIRQLGNFDA